MILKIILAILLTVIVAFGVVYYSKIQSFKKFIQFEQEIKKHPTDDLVREYMERYENTYIPEQPDILNSRGKFYRAIKANNNVSYEVKKELRKFMEDHKISTFSTRKNSDGIEEIINEDLDGNVID